MYRLSVGKIKTIKKHLTSTTAAIILAAASLSSSGSLLLPQPALAAGDVSITNVGELCTAIQQQADNQTWVIGPGTYALTQCNSVSAGNQTGWYFPITANNLTIRGIGNPTIYGNGFTADGDWHTQDLVAIFGNNVTIDGLTLMPKVEPNKTIEVMGSNATIENTTITPNTLVDPSEYTKIPSDPSDPNWSQEAKGWGGSIYYNNATGTQTLSNVQIHNGGVSVHSPNATINTTDLQLSYDTNVNWINDYRFYVATPTATINGTPNYLYHVNATLDNFDSVLAAVGDPTTLLGNDTISLDSNLTISQQVTLAKPMTLNGNGNTLSSDFTKSSYSNNAALGIQSNNVTVNNLVVNGANGVELHGINVYNATGVKLNDVTVENNPYSGLNVDGSAVTVTNLTTAHNGWDGVDVDKPGAVLTVNGTSHHTETTPDIYVDNATVGKVIDTNNQYGFASNVKQAGDRVYNLKPSVPIATLFDANGDSISKGSISTNSFTFHLSSSANVTRYQLRYWNDIPGSLFNGESHAWSPTNLSTTGHMNVLGIYTDSFTQGEGTHYFAFSACDAYGVCSDFSSPFVVTYDATVITDNFTVNMLTGDKVTLAPTVTSQTGPLTYAWTVSDSKLLNYPQDTKTGAALVIGPAPKGTYTVTLTVRDKYGYPTVATYIVTIADHGSPASVTPQVLGTSTGSTSSTGSTTQKPSTTDTSSYNDGEVLGAQTTTPSQNAGTTNASTNSGSAAPSNVETLTTNKPDTITHSRFLLLGWWWLVVVAALVGFFWLLLGRHGNHDAQ